LKLSSLHPGGAHDDLARWGAGLGGVRVVGLGEATHGSREFFTLKHRLIEYLVTERTFTVFALEADQDRCESLDRYVTTGEGDAAEGLHDLGYWTWDTQEMLACSPGCRRTTPRCRLAARSASSGSTRRTHVDAPGRDETGPWREPC